MRDMNRMMADPKPTVPICDIESSEVGVLPWMDLSSPRAAPIETHP